MRVLIVDDDRELVSVLSQQLSKAGLVVEACFEAKVAIELLSIPTPVDVIVLDLGLPDINGKDLLLKIRKLTPGVPVIALTAQADLQSVVRGLELGFDDYLTKPFVLAELVARIEVLYRNFTNTNSESTLKLGKLSINLLARTVFIQGIKLHLTNKEYGVLLTLVKNQNQPVSATSLLELVWDRNIDNAKSRLATTVSRLRKKIHTADLLITWQHRGYKIYEKTRQ